MNAITRKEAAALDAPVVSFKLNGRAGQRPRRARRSSRSPSARASTIPHLCYKPGLEAVGNCRACMVEIDGERVLAPSCCRHAERRA